MDTAVRTVFRPEFVESGSTTTPAPVRTLAVTATYLLSEAGRKTSLLARGDGHALQHVHIQVPANRLHLVTVNGRGMARLKLRPRFELNRQDRIVAIDAPPVFDTPPTFDDLLRVAARNHQLERAFFAQRAVNNAKRSETDRARRTEVAATFLRDQTQRAAVHPSPSPSRCYLNTPVGRIRFDIQDDDGPTRDVVREATRRFRADVHAAGERRARDRAEHLRLHDARKAAVASWVAVHGTDEQRARHAASVLSMREVIDAFADDAFRPLADRPPYRRDGLVHMQTHVRHWLGDDTVTIAPGDLLVFGRPAHEATPVQWAHLQAFQSTMPDVHLRLHIRDYVSKRHPHVPRLTHATLVCTKTVGPFTLRREYLMPGEERPTVR